MSSDTDLILEVVSPGQGLVLDLGGSHGELRHPLEKLGYQYVNVDIRRFQNGEPTLIADAHALPFKSSSFESVLSKDTLEHFERPREVTREVGRILRGDGCFIIWVPFMHPFHGDDFYRFTPLGLRYLLSDFEILQFENPHWVFTVIGLAMTEALKRVYLGFVERPIKRLSMA